MSVLFSNVTLSGNNEEIEFLVSGIPRCEEELQGSIAYEHFIEGTESETPIKAHVEAYIYGDGETESAWDEELVFIYSRIVNDEHFLSERCDNIESCDFVFMSPSDDLDDNNDYEDLEM